MDKKKPIAIEFTEINLHHTYIVLSTTLAWMKGYKSSKSYDFFGADNPPHCHTFEVLENLVKKLRANIFNVENINREDLEY